MKERRKCEFFLLRYVPDAVKDEFVNVGVLLFESSGGWADVRFTKDWRRVRCLDPDADVEMLEGLEREIKERMLEGASSREWLVKRMQDTFSNAIRLTPTKAVLADSPQEEIARLAEMYLERVKKGARTASGRMQIFQTMRGEFERQGVWTMMRHNVAVSEYTHKGDPLKIDAVYRPNGTVHMYQALSLGTDVNAAKVLAFSYPKIRDGVMRTEKAETALTAIVESEIDREDDATMFALETLSASQIMVDATADLPRIGLSIRQKMGLG
ncbi:MAG TPA: DUF3037 domain-containing protein [Candidatus Saccharimonadales bacterium]|nr:DUF3037 domain-containing protein [Candidatus Saccharimonadales bacterium]